MTLLMTNRYQLDGINKTYKANNSLSEFGYFITKYKISIYQKRDFKKNLCKICEVNFLAHLEENNCENCEKVVLLISKIKSRI